MAEGDPLLTITLSKRGDSFAAELRAPSGKAGVADLSVRGISENAVEAIETCVAELESKAADGDEVALRFTS
jgi:hypothetical protein